MAIIVPTLDAPNVSPRPLPTPLERTNHQPGEYGSSVVADAAATAAHVAQVVADEKRKADALAVQESLNQFRQYTDAGLEQVRRAEGKNAAIEAQKVYDDADKKAKELFGSLANDDQRRLFTQHANVELTQTRRIGDEHVGNQIRAAREMEFQAANATSLRRAARFGVELPDVVSQEVASIDQRVAQYAVDRGLPAVAAKALRDGEVAKVYLAVAQVAYEKDPAEAAAILAAHADVTGEEGAALLARAHEAVRRRAADDLAIAVLAKHRNPDGTFDETAALADADALHPAGPDRNDLRAAVVARARLAADGRRAQEGQNWDAALGVYVAQSPNPARRSVDAMRTSLAFAKLTPDQVVALENRERADKSAAQGQPLTSAQLKALGRLENDIIDRPDFWATASPETLHGSADFNLLPERYRVQLVGQVAATHRDREDPEALLKSAEHVMRARAQANGILSDKTKKALFDKWPDDDQKIWNDLQDRVGPLIATWKASPENKGKRIPNSVIEGIVDHVTRQGVLKGGGWLWTDKGGVTPVEAAQRSAQEQKEHPFIPDIHADEESLGRYVQLRRGFDPKATSAAFSNASLIFAAADWRNAQAGPGPQEREVIVNALRSAGLEPTPELIQVAFEKKRLKFIK